jgi:hypothetical protein
MTNRQVIVEVLNEIGRPDAAALIPVGVGEHKGVKVSHLDCKGSYADPSDIILFCFPWGDGGIERFWVDVYEQVKAWNIEKTIEIVKFMRENGMIEESVS